MRRLTTGQRKKVERAIQHHERYKSSYFWSPPANASDRRAQEMRDSFELSFVNNSVRYSYTSNVSCSCKNVYYYGRFEVNGERKNVSAFRRLLDRS